MAIAIFSTWTTYGTWLPGDSRGWYQRGRGFQSPDARRQLESMLKMSATAITLDRDQRPLVEKTIARHCEIRRWELHAANCRSNHVHVVVTAPNCAIELPREQFKAWCTRRLKELANAVGGPVRQDWWTERGWDEYIDTEIELVSVNDYVREGQDWHP